MKPSSRIVLRVLGVVGIFVWVTAIFLRGTPFSQGDTTSFLLGIAPNFGAGLALPVLAMMYYPRVFGKEITRTEFIHVLYAVFPVLLLSEIIHDRFLNSRFDVYDMAASLVAVGIMALAGRHS